jgi:large subunit ribosomal protein L10
MPKSKEQKQEILQNLKEKMESSKSIVFTGFNALGVKDNEELRSKLKEQNSEYYVAKKSLFDKALKDSNLDLVSVKEFEGKIAGIFSYEDEVAGAKIIGEFKKDKEKSDKVVFLGGILENKLLNSDEVDSLSKLPSKQELYAKVVGSINAPVSGFVNVLAGNLRGLVNVLKAVSEKK